MKTFTDFKIVYMRNNKKIKPSPSDLGQTHALLVGEVYGKKKKFKEWKG